MRRILLILAFGSTVLVPAQALACSFSNCFEGSFLPARGVVPPNLTAIVWTPRAASTSDVPSTEAVQFIRTDGTEPEDVTFTLETSDAQTLIVPDQALAPGANYRIEGLSFCSPSGSGVGDPTTASFETATEDAPFPTSLGTLSRLRPRVAPLNVSTVSGSCTSEVTAAQMEVHLRLSDEAQPWSQLFEYSTWVDGVRWKPRHSHAAQTTHGTSWQGRAMDLLYAACQSEDPGADLGLSEGIHQVEFQAVLPGTATVLSSDAIEVNLRCDAANNTGCRIGPHDAITSWLLGALTIVALLAQRRSRTQT